MGGRGSENRLLFDGPILRNCPLEKSDNSQTKIVVSLAIKKISVNYENKKNNEKVYHPASNRIVICPLGHKSQAAPIYATK